LTGQVEHQINTRNEREPIEVLSTPDYPLNPLKEIILFAKALSISSGESGESCFIEGINGFWSYPSFWNELIWIGEVVRMILENM